MDTKQSEVLRLAYTLDLLAMDMEIPRMAATELRRLHAETEALRAGYDAVRLEIESLQAQLAAIGAGGVEPLRKRCLHQISEPQAQPVAWRYQTPTGWHATTDASAALRVRHHHEVEPLYAAPQSAAPAQAGEYPELPDGLVGSILGAAYDFRDAHLAGSKNLKCSAHVEFEATVITALRAARGAAQAAPVDAAAQEDAERWQFLAEYLVGTRTDLDDEIVGCDSVQKMARVLDAARAAQKGSQ